MVFNIHYKEFLLFKVYFPTKCWYATLVWMRMHVLGPMFKLFVSHVPIERRYSFPQLTSVIWDK